MSGHSYNGKRRSEHLDSGGSKRRYPGEERDGYMPGPEDTVYRFLCPGKRIGSIIGRGGEIAKQLRGDTRAKIRIGDSIPGCEERVITIFSESDETNMLEGTGDMVCPAQDALFRVYERVTADEGPEDEEEGARSPEVMVRLLVPSDQIGCILGKGGQIIQDMRSDTGAQIRILKKELLPSCAVPGDELVQISGEAYVVRKALLQVSLRLHHNPSRSNHLLVPNVAPMHIIPNPGPHVVGMAPIISSYGSYKGERSGEWPAMIATRRDESSMREFTLRLLCASGLIGGVIGKNGAIIKQIRQESGASIKVDSSTTDADCIIMISSREFFEDPFSPAIDAAVRLQPRCSERTDAESGDPSYTTRLLVSTSRIGCLIGRGGNIISEMRRSTRANIRILSKESIPKVASEHDEMVQISGDLDVARDALIQVTTRLKANFFERENALATLPAAVPYNSMYSTGSDNLKYSGRESKSHGYRHSYSSGYGASGDDLLSGHYDRYGSLQDAGSSYGSYGGYSGRSSSTRSGIDSSSHGRHRGY